MQNNEIVRQINAYAMQHGIVLGLFGVGSLAVFKWSFTFPFFSTLFSVMLLATPVLATVLTLQYRNAIRPQEPSFSFARGFLHALFTGFYASIWVALFTFVYLQYFDHGTIFAAYGRSLETPETRRALRESGIDAQLNQLTGGRGVQGLVDAMQAVGAATYASLSLYFTLIFGPFISAVIGLVCRRK